jgi:hypothetical protein
MADIPTMTPQPTIISSPRNHFNFFSNMPAGAVIAGFDLEYIRYSATRSAC